MTGEPGHEPGHEVGAGAGAASGPVRVDFYQLERDPIERVVPALAQKALAAGMRLAVFHREASARETISAALWAAEGSFLAHGMQGEGDEARQPIVLAADPPVANGAGAAVLADGEWRGSIAGMARHLLLFGPERTEAARDLWRVLSGTQGHALHIYKQRPDGAWREGR